MIDFPIGSTVILKNSGDHLPDGYEYYNGMKAVISSEHHDKRRIYVTVLDKNGVLRRYWWYKENLIPFSGTYKIV